MTHDGCNALQRVAPFYRDFCHGSQQVATRFRSNHAFSTWLVHFCHHSIWTFLTAVHQPDDVRMSTFPQICNHSWSCRTSFLGGATVHRMNWCKFLEVILAWPSRHSTTGTSSSGASGPRRFSLTPLHERIRRRIRLCFCTFIENVKAITIVSFSTLPFGFPTMSKNSLSTLFCPLILDHGTSSHNFRFWRPKFLIS